MKKRCENGFTLYELLITLLVIGVILSLGVPNLQEFSANNRITAIANDMHSSFLLARSEAARARAPVTICTSNIPLDPNPICTGTLWDEGWIVFIDQNGDLLRDPGDALLRAHPPIDDAVSITTNNFSDYFSFAPTGLGRGDVFGLPSVTSARICDDRGNTVVAGGWSAARILVVTPVGRATVLRDPVAIAGQGDCP